MCVLDREAVGTDCLSKLETTVDGMEERGRIDTAGDVKHDMWNLGTLEPSKNKIRTYLQMGRWVQRGSAVRIGLSTNLG